MKKMNIGLLQSTLFTAMLFTQTGCFFGLFNEEPAAQSLIQVTPTIQTSNTIEIKTPLAIEKTTPSISSTSQTPYVECTDEVDSGCQKELIKPEELAPQKSLTQVNNAIHNLKSIQGHKITIEERSTGYFFPEFQNRIVVLEMFGKNCSHCIREMPTMRKLKRRYRNHIEIVALQVEGKMSKREARRLIKRHKITYPIIPGESAKALQFHVQSTFGWTGILPFIMVIKDGVTEFTYRGEVSYNRINKDILSLLK